MRISIHLTGNGRRGAARLSIAALAVALAWPGIASAAPPVAAVLCSEMVGQAEFGSIKGRIVWGGEEIPAPKVLVAKGMAANNPEVCARNQTLYDRDVVVVDPKTKGVLYCCAYLSRPKGSNPDAVKELLAKQPTVAIDQKNCEFLPYLTVMHEGQTLVVTSSDAGINHNFHITGFNNGANQNVPAGTELKLKLNAESRPIPVECNIHPWMKANVLIVDHPFYAAAGTDGSFEIKGVPAGTQNLVLWHKSGYVNKGAGRGMPVVVKAGEVTDVGEIVLTPKS
jgi:hypothetical protein